MRITYDAAVEALYIALDEGSVVRSVEIDEGTLVDLSEDGRALGIEVLRPARDWPIAEISERFGLDGPTQRLLQELHGSHRRMGHNATLTTA